MAGVKSTEQDISISWIVYASPEQVYQALTNESLIEKWTGEKAEFKPEINAHYNWFNNWVSGHVTHLENNLRLGITWKPANWPKNSAHSTVNFTFKKHAAGCEVLLVQTGFPNREEKQKHHDGWIANVFEPLNDYFTFT